MTILSDLRNAWYCLGEYISGIETPAPLRAHPGKRWYGPQGFSETNDGAYSIMSLRGTQNITQPASVRIYYTGAAPAVFGFDVNFYCGGVVKNVQIRHTYVAGDSQLNALKDMLEQFQCHPDIVALYGAYDGGPDILSYAYVRREMANGEPHRLNIFGHWKITEETQMNLAAVSGVLVEGVGLPNTPSGTMSPLLEIAPFFIISRSTMDQGRNPRAGDLLGGIVFGGDVLGNADKPGRKSETRNADPMYGWIEMQIIDPAYARGAMVICADEFHFQDKSGNCARFKLSGNQLVPC